MKTVLASLIILVTCGVVQIRAEQVNGVSLAHLHRRGMGYGSDECKKELAAVKATGANWIALNDFAYMQNVADPNLRFDRDGSMREADIMQTVRDAHAIGLKVLIKPHIWSRDFGRAGKWAGDIQMNSEADWSVWFKQYGDYVLYNARLAAETKADALCIGVELEKTSTRDADWRKLIADVRKIYDGPLCYSAAFLEWQKITWWDAVDVIGITAYFPVATVDAPTDQQIRDGWTKVYDELIPFARKLNRKICFTEIGYTASTTAGKEPWSANVKTRDEQLQSRLYRIALEEAARHDELVGVFVWKWFTSSQWRQHERSDPFAVQDQPHVLEALKAAWMK